MDGSRDPPSCPAAAANGKFGTPFSGMAALSRSNPPSLLSPFSPRPCTKPLGLGGGREVCGSGRHPFSAQGAQENLAPASLRHQCHASAW